MKKLDDSFETPFSSSKKTIPNSTKKTKIIMNVSQTQYAVVKHIGKKLKWNLSFQPSSNLNFDICWMDGHIRQQFFARMENHQKINHFPGMGVLSRKNNLGKNLMLFRTRFPGQYQFFPITWNLPTQSLDLQSYHDCRKPGKAQTFIVKPEASCQGRGIFLTRNIDRIKNDKCVVQRYIHKPYLIDGLKFDLRIYVLITGIDPLRIFVYEEGLARFATQPYKPPRSENLENRYMHLTNYAVNKQNPNFIFNESVHEMNIGHKRSLTSVYKQIQDDGHDIIELKKKINDIFIKTMITGYPNLSGTLLSVHPDNFANDMCFEILGFDIMVDHKLNPYLLEINYTPSFSTDTPLDRYIKKNLIYDTISLLNISDKWKKGMKIKRDKQIQERMVSGKRKKYSNEQRELLMNNEARKRDLYQEEHSGGFTKIFLLHEQQMDQYRKFYDYAFQIHKNFTGTGMKNFTSTNQYPYYKHYFEGISKSYHIEKIRSKAKKNPLEYRKKDSSQTKVLQLRTSDHNRSSSIPENSHKSHKSSAKPEKYINIYKKENQNKLSSKAFLKNDEDSTTKDITDFQQCAENESLFQNKRLQEIMGLKKRKSEAFIGKNQDQS